MIKQFSKKSYRWSAFGLILIFVLGGAVLTNAKSLSQEDKATTDLSTSMQKDQETLNVNDFQKNEEERMGSLSQAKPLSNADLTIGSIEIDGDMNDVVKNYGQPSEKTTAHGIGTPYWIFEKQGLAIDFGGPIWNITVFGSFEGSTPRGIHIGSSASEVLKAYPDITPGESYIQTSTDGKYSIQFAMSNEKVAQIVITHDSASLDAQKEVIPRIVANGKLAGKGPVTKANTSIGGIHIGDSQDQVRRLLGEPSKIRNGGGGTPDIMWYYEHENAYISFYRHGEKEPVGGVDEIQINNPSGLKTNKNIGIGSSVQELLSAYPDVAQSKPSPENSTTYWLNGTRLEEGFYYPSLGFAVGEDGQIGHFYLTSWLIDPEK
ncbi:outer membrane protein assembly factor BamE [Paenibacillus doosanensis]|uniref:outer membrane protein assembly factor BamE n=1 Tax=Paenibacillus doosanensis TaxID=1229154 RepID=UPI0021804FB9|nr:outer membrane protein assembly factor BamE [Paenibacillus doosanensis]